MLRMSSYVGGRQASGKFFRFEAYAPLSNTCGICHIGFRPISPSRVARVHVVTMPMGLR